MLHKGVWVQKATRRRRATLGLVSDVAPTPQLRHRGPRLDASKGTQVYPCPHMHIHKAIPGLGPHHQNGSERHKALTPVHRMADKLVYSCHWGFMSQISWSHYDCHLGRGSSPCPHCSWEPRPFGPELPGEVRTSALGSILRGGLCCQENTLTLMFFPSASKPHTRHLMPFL